MKNLLSFLTIATLALPGFAAEPKPNILFIAVDDLNNRLGCYGDPIVMTPHIDRLATRGVRFDRAYCQFPLCNPSRASFLSGRFPTTTQVTDNDRNPRATLGDVQLLPEYFAAHGYFTAKAGKIPHGTFDSAVKWTVKDGAVPAPANDDEAAPARAGKNARGQKATKKTGAAAAAAGETLPASVAWRALDVPDEATSDGRSARQVVAFLEHAARDKTKPFFIAVGFHKPHRPYEAPRSYFSDYRAEKMPLAPQPPQRHQEAPEIAYSGSPSDADIPAQQQRDAIAAYHACITFIDAQAGLVLEALDRLGLASNTIVVFASDHGYLLGEHGGVWRKMSLFEESAHVPLLIAAPGKKPGVSPRTVGLVDLFPTLTELCGLPPPAGLEGVSLAPLLDDPRAEWTRPAITFVTRKGDGLAQRVRTERWAFAAWPDGEFTLYDHDADPREFTNLAAAPAHAATVAHLKTLLRPLPAEKKARK